MNKDDYPNIVSSYPAEEVFITNTWLSEGVYKDIFDLMDYQPRLKINIRTATRVLLLCLPVISIGWLRPPLSISGICLSVFPKPILFTNGRNSLYQ